MNIKRKKILSWILLIAWMAVIFIYSSQPGDVSDSKSKFVIYIFNLLGINLESTFGNMANFVVRKAAHTTEYMILFLLYFNVLKHYFTRGKSLILSLVFVFLYACTDEYHQTFVEGRSGQFKDVLIDTGGGTLGLVITYLRYYLRKKTKL